MIIHEGSNDSLHSACAVRGSFAKFKMAERGKRLSRPPKRLIDEYLPVFKAKNEKKMRKDNQLYEIEIREVDKEKQRIKIHYKGFREDTDEWRDYGDDFFPFVRLEKAYIPQEISLEDRKNNLYGQLYREVKRKLWSGRRDDPDIRIELNMNPDVFDQGLGLVVKACYQRQREVYQITDNHDLDDLLGLKWNERILNENGDFAYVINGTVKYWLSKKSSIVEYKYIGAKYIKSEIEDSHMLVFTFVRGDGNKIQYLNGAF